MLATVWLCALVAVLNMIGQLPERATRWDFSIYYMSATLLLEGSNPYTADFGPTAERLGLDAGEIRRATDPPTFLLLIEPLALMPERAAYYTWVGLNAVFLAAALMLLLSRSAGLGLRSAAALAALALLYPPVEWHFYAAQSKIPLLLLLVIMIRLMERGSHRAAGLCLAFAGLLRIFPLLLIAYLVIQRRWRTLLWTLVGLMAGGLITIGLIGANRSLSFGHSLLLLTGQHVPWMSPGVPANIALGAAVSRLFRFIAGENHNTTIDMLGRLAVFGAQAALLGASVAATLRLKPREDPDWRAFSMWVVASVILSPTAWVHYMVIYLLPFGQLVRASGASRASERAQWTAILSYLVIFLTSVMLMPLAGIVYAHYGREQTRWFMSLMVEGWFVSAMLAYLSTFWFTTDKPPAFDKVVQDKQSITVSPGNVAAIN